MNISFPLLSLTLLFWGWRVDHLWIALLMALLLESSRFVSWRWHPDDRDLYRVTDLGTLILLGLFLYPYLAGSHTAYSSQLDYAVQIFPLAFFPLMLAQAYTTRGDFPLSGLFYSLRKESAGERKAIRLDYPFFGLCILSSASGVVQSPWYFPGVVLLIALALWLHRPKRYSLFLWVLILLLAFGLADQEQKGILLLHRTLGDVLVRWASQWFMPEQDPYQQNTALGDIGVLKLSDRILFRVEQPSPWKVPLLLRKASYNRLIGNTWHSPFVALRELPLTTPIGSWQLIDKEQGHASLSIYQRFKGTAMLETPQGAVRLEDLPAIAVSMNAYGAIKVKDSPGFVSYRVFYDPGRSFDAPPDATDLLVPAQEKPALEKITKQLALAGLPSDQVLARLEQYFLENFHYTLHLTDEGNASTPMARFLLDTRAGHCEYFASATTLLLRQAGIPARYVVGYSVQETEGHLQIVRARHAHAWSSAYRNGVWQDVDNTPPDWTSLEEKNASSWSILTDLWSRAWFVFDQYRNSKEPRETWPWLMLAALFSGIMIWRTVRGTGTRKHTASQSDQAAVALPPFAQIEAHLVRQGWTRGIGEPLGIWLRRIRRTELLPLLSLHYRDCYDPYGLSPEEKQHLAEAVNQWLTQKGV